MIQLKKISCFLVLLSLHCHSQQLVYRNYTVEDGLAASTVYRTLQDKKGFIWFATEHGLSRFDGQSFINYSFTDGLTDITILNIHEDSKGTLWLMTLSGRVFFFKNEKIHELKLPEPFDGFIRDVTENPQGTDWLASDSNGLLKYKNGQLSPIPIIYDTPETLKINEFCKTADNAIWLLTTHCLVKIVGDSIFQYNYLPTINKSLVHNIFAIKKHILYATDGELVEFYTENNQRLIAGQSELEGRAIHSIFVDKDLNIWLATNKGAVCLGNDLSHPDFNAVFFKETAVTSLMEDREGNLWVSTLGNGVFFVPSRNIYTYTTEDGITDNKVNCITGNKKGEIWIGTDNDKVDFFEKKKWHSIDIPIAENKRNHVSSVLFKDDDLWIAQNDIIAIIPDKEYTGNEKTRTYSLKAAIKCMDMNIDGSMLVGTHLGLFIIKNDNIALTPVRGRITSVFVDLAGKIWLCKDAKLFQYDGIKQIPYYKKNDLLSTRTYCIRQSADSTIWIATQGAGMVSIKNNKVSNISIEDGLVSNTCNSMFIDDTKKTIWVATNKGLSKIVFSNDRFFSISNITSVHGLPSNEVNDIYKQGDTLWLATNKGVCFFAERKLEFNKIPPPVYFSDVKIMEKDTIVLPNYQLSYNENNISIDYVGLAYRNVESIRYKYRMTEIDSNWNYTSFSQVQYPQLHPGEYTFTVSAMNEDGLWSKDPATLHFTIKPPFWQTWWFITSFVLLIITSISTFVYLRINSIRKREKEKTIVNRKIAALEMTALRSQMNPHFIFNCLNSIQNFINKSDEENANLYLTKFAELLRMILEHSRKETILLSEELKALRLYVDLELLRFDNKFEYDVRPPETNDLETIRIPPLLLQPFVENAIRHGLMHKESQGKVLITFKKVSTYLLCIIEDDGIGRKRAEEIRQMQLTKTHSVGLQITHERMQTFYNREQNEMYFTFTDLYDTSGNPSGTRVEIRIPR